MIDVEQLRSKILDLAISGKLVPQDPNDEPASVLLERIQKEKEALVKTGKIKKADPPSIIYKGSDNRYYEKTTGADVTDDVLFKDVPGNWLITTLGSLGEIVSGGTPKTDEPLYWNGGDISWIGPADMGKWRQKFITKTSKKITSLGLRHSGAVLMPAGSIIMSSRAPIGYLGISTFPICTNQGCKSIIPSSLINKAYLYYVLLAMIPWFKSHGSGTTFKEISGRQFAKCPIPLPPIAGQNHIANKIDHCFQLIGEIQKSYLLCSKDAVKLKAKVLSSFFDSSDSDKSYYELKPLSEIAEITMGQSVGSEEMLSTCQNGSLEFHQGKTHFGKGVLFSSNIYVINPRKIALPNSILMCVRAPVGDVIFCDRKIAIGRGLCSISPHKDTDINFLFNFLLFSKNWFVLQSTGSTFQAITIKTVKTLRVPVFRYEKETEIAKEIRIIFSQIDKLID